MPTLWIIDIEAHEQRYTREWRDHLPAQLERAAKDRGQSAWTIRVISGEAGEQVPTAGAFLNFAATNIYKSSQVITIAKAFEKGEIKPGDRVLVTDAWNPGIIQLRYMIDLLNVPVEIHALWHAGSYDPWDFLGRQITDRRWSTAFETALFHAIDVNHFASQFHVDLFKRTFGTVDDTRICCTGWPMEYLPALLHSGKQTEKAKLVLFPHRIAPEKQIEIFRDLGSAFPGYQFDVCQDRALTKTEYHALLRQAVMIFSANLQETLGISLYEGALCGAMPLAPNRLSYSEMYDDYWLYPSEWTETWTAYQQNKTKLVGRIKRMLDDVQQQPKLIIERLDALSAKLGEHYFSGTRLYDRIFSGNPSSRA